MRPCWALATPASANSNAIASMATRVRTRAPARGPPTRCRVRRETHGETSMDGSPPKENRKGTREWFWCAMLYAIQATVREQVRGREPPWRGDRNSASGQLRDATSAKVSAGSHGARSAFVRAIKNGARSPLDDRAPRSPAVPHPALTAPTVPPSPCAHRAPRAPRQFPPPIQTTAPRPFPLPVRTTPPATPPAPQPLPL